MFQFVFPVCRIVQTFWIALTIDVRISAQINPFSSCPSKKLGWRLLTYSSKLQALFLNDSLKYTVNMRKCLWKQCHCSRQATPFAWFPQVKWANLSVHSQGLIYLHLGLNPTFQETWNDHVNGHTSHANTPMSNYFHSNNHLHYCFLHPSPILNPVSNCPREPGATEGHSYVSAISPEASKDGSCPAHSPTSCQLHMRMEQEARHVTYWPPDKRFELPDSALLLWLCHRTLLSWLKGLAN